MKEHFAILVCKLSWLTGYGESALNNQPDIWVSVYKECSWPQVFAEWLDWQQLINGRIIAWYLDGETIKSQII